MLIIYLYPSGFLPSSPLCPLSLPFFPPTSHLSSSISPHSQAELLESAPAIRAAAIAADKAKLEALERTLGITQPPPSSSSNSPSSSSTPLPGEKRRNADDINLEEIAMKRHKFEDNAYFEESREINDGVRNAVAAGELVSWLGFG
jgi:hypothetical protein